MRARLSQWTTAHPLLAFYLLAFGLTWLGWIPQLAYSYGRFPFDHPVFYLLGGSGPLLAVILMQRLLSGRSDIGAIFAPYTRWRVGVGWYGVALFGFAALWLTALIRQGTAAIEVAQLGPPLALIPTFLIAFVAAIPEEVAWRGFAQTRLQTRHTALTASLIVGSLWALWHLPLLLMRGSVMATYPLLPYLVYVVALAIIYTWIFNSTGGSLLLITLFHAASNTVGPFPGVELTLVVILAAAAVVLVFGAQRLTPRPPAAEAAPLAAGGV